MTETERFMLLTVFIGWCLDFLTNVILAVRKFRRGRGR